MNSTQIGPLKSIYEHFHHAEHVFLRDYTLRCPPFKNQTPVGEDLRVFNCFRGAQIGRQNFEATVKQNKEVWQILNKVEGISSTQNEEGNSQWGEYIEYQIANPTGSWQEYKDLKASGTCFKKGWNERADYPLIENLLKDCSTPYHFKITCDARTNRTYASWVGASANHQNNTPSYTIINSLPAAPPSYPQSILDFGPITPPPYQQSADQENHIQPSVDVVQRDAANSSHEKETTSTVSSDPYSDLDAILDSALDEFDRD